MRRFVAGRFLMAWMSLAAVVGAPSLTAAPQAQLVVIVSMDGLRPDAVQRARTPVLDSLRRQGSYTWKARTVLPSITLVSHTSMLTGVEPKRHGVIRDTHVLPRRPLRVPTVFELAKRAGYPTGMIVGKQKLKYLAKPGTVDDFDYPGYWAKEVAAAAVKRLARQQRGILFLHFPDPDSLGHRYGWMSARQLKGVTDCDTALGKVVGELERRGLFPRTVIVVSADHGGHGKVHGTKDPRDMTIPWICAGPGIRRNHALRVSVHTCDTAAMALHVLGIAVPGDWRGHVVTEALAAPVVRR